MEYESPISQRMNWEEWLSQGKEASPSVGSMGTDLESIRAGLAANGDWRGLLDFENYQEQKKQFGLQSEALGKLNQKPSAWATGTQAFGNVAQGLAGLGSIYLGMQGMKEQKKMNKFNMGMANTNMNNSILDYNRRLEGTLQNRALNNGGGQGYVSEQLARYSARRSG